MDAASLDPRTSDYPSLPKYFRRKRMPLAAAKAGLLWLRNPTSESGAKQIFRIAYCLGGPQIHKMAKKMRANPKFNEILEQRNDLGQTLADMESLSKLPEGSLGKYYHDFMSGDGIFPSYLLGGLPYKNGHFDALQDWDEDAKFLITRVGSTHDLIHLIAGYGTDFPGEAILISYSAAAGGMPKWLASILGVFMGAIEYPIFQPRIGFFKWVSIFRDAAVRGAIMAKQNSMLEINYEEMLNKPIKVARELMGVPPIKHQELVNEDGFLVSKDWMNGPLAKRIQDGGSEKVATLQGIDKARALIEKLGVSIRDVMSAPRKNVIAAYDAYDEGTEKEEVLRILRDYQYNFGD